MRSMRGMGLSMQEMLFLRMKSKVENLTAIQKRILDYATQWKFDEDSLYCLRLAMDEAVVNAIIHGNKNDESKDIHIEARCHNGKLRVSVRDEGHGFDRTNLPDPRQEPHLHEPHGRGIFLIKEFTDEVRFNDKGNEITFTIGCASSGTRPTMNS